MSGKGPRTINGQHLDVRSLAELWGSTEHRIRHYVRLGYLPFRRLGGRLIFLRREIEQFEAQMPGRSIAEALDSIKALREGTAE